jgi:hypothetical protein
MTRDKPSIEQSVANVFAAQTPSATNEDRVHRIIQRIRTEVVSRDVLLFVMVRIWLTVLEFGAVIYARRDPRKGARS